MNLKGLRPARWCPWRSVRWAVVAVMLPAVFACTARSLQQPVPSVTKTEKRAFQQTINRNIDIVFEIDNSISMAHEQANLVANFPAFINILKNLPGGLPNVHIGVVTSDMGAGAFTRSVPGCDRPDMGSFVDTARVAIDPICGTARLNAGQHFIESSNGGTQNNFSGNITDVFRCIAEVGTTGCGFEDHLESVRAALGDPVGDPSRRIAAAPVPGNNTGFLRDDAYLAVILITNEEECSTTPDNVLFELSPAADAALGHIQTRCFGHTDICDGQSVANYVKAGTPVGPFQNCVPDEATFSTDRTHGAIPVQFYVDYFNRRKTNPSKVLLSGIIAPAAPYSLVSTPDTNGGMFLGQGNSCTGAAGVFGQPTPRLTKFFSSFPAQQSITTSICDQSFAGAMQQIANRLSVLIGSPCINGNVLSVMGPNGPRPDCRVVDHATTAQGAVMDTPVAACSDNGNAAPCWTLAPGVAGGQCSGQQIMQFMRPAGMPPTNLDSTVECSIAVCAAGVHNPPMCP